MGWILFAVAAIGLALFIVGVLGGLDPEGRCRWCALSTCAGLVLFVGTVVAAVLR